MKKIGQLYREAFEDQIKNNLDKTSSLFVLHYSGVRSSNLMSLRKNLNKSQGRLFIVKNTLARRVLNKPNYQAIAKMVDGPTAFVFGYGDPASISKILINFLKENEKCILEGGLLADKIMDKKMVQTLASLPTRNILLSWVVGQMKAPITGLVVALNYNLQKLVLVLEQIKKKKS